jgi:hypothetical protein
MNRRHFLQTSLASFLSVPAFALEADNPYRKNIGIQLYTLRNQINADLPGTLKAVAEAGYKQVEPYGFPDATALDLIKVSKDLGMAANSSHFAWESVTDPDKAGVAPFADILQKAKDAGLSHLVIPYLHGDSRKTADDYKRLAERCNVGAALAKEAGIQLAYHNHNFEFQPFADGKSGYEVFAAEFSPEMKFELDVFWVKVGGIDPSRACSARLKGACLADPPEGSENRNDAPRIRQGARRRLQGARPGHHSRWSPSSKPPPSPESPTPTSSRINRPIR